jgi:hypothetical protein
MGYQSSIEEGKTLRLHGFRIILIKEDGRMARRGKSYNRLTR